MAMEALVFFSVAMVLLTALVVFSIREDRKFQRLRLRLGSNPVEDLDTSTGASDRSTHVHPAV